jgi:hypothetical protein
MRNLLAAKSEADQKVFEVGPSPIIRSDHCASFVSRCDANGLYAENNGRLTRVQKSGDAKLISIPFMKV